ncbi:WD-40 repeat-containing protein [Mycena albidolilacea]|uniref:ASTRA-associated protein 1 n=1 Tax=Mycena albidolilacea TaxID=1033008 RepID=A0AAD7A9G2_9AGAR|nr:WD-40 repeat-containing protein [Mycena albidolilacea]
MNSPAPPAPTHLIRSHSSDVTALFFSDDNERLYSGDASGRVVVTSTRSLRTIVSWLAHTDSILGVHEWGPRIVTHSRNHKLHVWTRVEDLPASARVGGSAALSDLPSPVLCYSLDVNALNYCRFSLLPSASHPDEALIALPNLVESSEADVWVLPSKQRIHASVGTERTQSMFSLGGREEMRTGLIMSLHLFRATPPLEGSSSQAGELRLVCAYEDGSVALRRFVGSAAHPETSIEGRGWEVIWKCKLHVEAIMAMRVSSDNRLALTVSADHLVGRYDLASEAGAGGDADAPGTVHRTSHPGNGCIAIRDDARVCAIGGWDGRIRLYSTKNLKPLGTLRYHKSGCQAVEFARPVHADVTTHPKGDEDDDEDEEMTSEELEARGRWLAAGAKDHRVSLWALISFAKT